MNEIEINNLKNLDVCGTDTLKTLTHKTFSQFFDSITHEYQINTKVRVIGFNDFVYFKTRESILKRVINNRLSGSAWNFHKFNYLNVKVLKVADQIIR